MLSGFLFCQSGKPKINGYRRICEREQTYGKHCNVDPFSSVTGSSYSKRRSASAASISFMWRRLKVLRSLFGTELSLPGTAFQSEKISQEMI